MKRKREIKKDIKKLLGDERLSYKTATVFENAPLALVQLSLETRLHTLEDVLGVPLTDVKKLRGEEDRVT